MTQIGMELFHMDVGTASTLLGVQGDCEIIRKWVIPSVQFLKR